jgi:hypothetical protein
LLHAIGTFDSQALVGIFLKNEDWDLWATNQTIEAKIIYEDRPSRWLIILLVMMSLGLETREFI